MTEQNRNDIFTRRTSRRLKYTFTCPQEPREQPSIPLWACSDHLSQCGRSRARPSRCPRSSCRSSSRFHSTHIKILSTIPIQLCVGSTSVPHPSSAMAWLVIPVQVSYMFTPPVYSSMQFCSTTKCHTRPTKDMHLITSMCALYI